MIQKIDENVYIKEKENIERNTNIIEKNVKQRKEDGKIHIEKNRKI